MSKEIKQSASRLKTAKTCSWLYWCNYHLKLPDKSNEGAMRGDICHSIFEFLGREDRKPYYEQAIGSGNIYSIPSLKKFIYKKAKTYKIDDNENLSLMNDMIIAGLEYDFFGKQFGEPTQVYSEKEFDLHIVKNNGEIDFKIRGFIDKLFLYDSISLAIIRDFKSSKKKFEGDEVDKNLQDFIYSVAVREMFPQYKKRESEFLFLKFDLSNGKNSDGLLKMKKISKIALDSFEKKLTKSQKYLENFNIRTAKSNYAADKKIAKDSGFEGIIVCGFAKAPGELKKDGKPKWHCKFKFPFEYYALYETDGKLIKTAFLEDYDQLLKIKKENQYIKRENYEGCPRWNQTSY